MAHVVVLGGESQVSHGHACPVDRPCGPRCGASRSGQRAGPALGACDQHGFLEKTALVIGLPEGVVVLEGEHAVFQRARVCSRIGIDVAAI